LDNEFCEKQQAMLKIVSALTEGEASVKNEEDWMPIAEAMQRLGL